MQQIGAVDIGGTKIAVGLVSPQAQVMAVRTFPSRPEQAFESLMDEIAGHLDEMLADRGESLVGIGIGSTGQVDPKTGLVLNNSLQTSWNGQNPVDWLAKRFGVSVALENDADAAALAEWKLGAGKGAQRMIYVTISTGIGAGMVFQDQLYRGAGGVHPEVGHHTIDSTGPACFCGSRGCWETLASGSALARRMKEYTPGFEGDAVQVCDLAQAGDSLAVKAVQAHASALGIGLANLITIYAPDVIVLGGGLMRRSALFLPGARAVIAERCRLVPPQNTLLKESAFRADSGLVGAAWVWVYHFQPQDHN